MNLELIVIFATVCTLIATVLRVIVEIWYMRKRARFEYLKIREILCEEAKKHVVKRRKHKHAK